MTGEWRRLLAAFHHEDFVVVRQGLVVVAGRHQAQDHVHRRRRAASVSCAHCHVAARRPEQPMANSH